MEQSKNKLYKDNAEVIQAYFLPSMMKRFKPPLPGEATKRKVAKAKAKRKAQRAARRRNRR